MLVFFVKFSLASYLQTLDASHGFLLRLLGLRFQATKRSERALNPRLTKPTPELHTLNPRAPKPGALNPEKLQTPTP